MAPNPSFGDADAVRKDEPLKEELHGSRDDP